MTMVERFVQGRIEHALDVFRVVQVAGARQTGKTTLARLIAADDREFVTMDAAAPRMAAERDPDGFLASYGDRPMLIDEVQRVPDLYLAIKRVVDESPRPGRFLLTGSSEPRSGSQIRDSLAGRIKVVELRPFSQGEIAGVREQFVEALASAPDPATLLWPTSRHRGVQAYMPRMLAGGYPDAIRLDSRDRRDWLREYAAAVCSQDVRHLAAIHDLARLRAVFDLVASQSGQLLKPSSLARDAKLASSTAHNWIQLLAETRTIDVIPPWSGGQRARLVNTPRGYIVDSGLLAAMLQIDAERVLREPMQLGALVETFVVQELLRQCSWLADPPALLHYRDRDQREVDVVLERPDGGVIGIEVKAAATVHASDTKGIRALERQVGDRFAAGIVLYCGEHPLPLGERTRAVPLEALWAPLVT